MDNYDFVDKISKTEVHYLTEGVETNVHKIKIIDLMEHYGTNMISGLSAEVVEARLKEHGANRLTPPANTSLWLRFMKQMFVGFATLLWAGALLCFVVYALQLKMEQQPPPDMEHLGMALLGLIVLIGFCASIQERKSADIVDSIHNLVPPYANVRRDGKLFNIPAENLVVGDIVRVKFGDRVPADIRMLQCDNLRVDNSVLTGETEPGPLYITYTSDDPLETRNLAFLGTTVVQGTCTAMVIATGDNTVLGRIANLSVEPDKGPVSVSSETQRLIRQLTLFAILLGCVLGTIALCLGCSWLNVAIYVMGFIVANVPEGLLVTVTVCLALSSRRLYDKNCLVKSLNTVVTLGSISTICLDKTGTLTQGRMTVVHLWYDGQIVTSDSRESFRGSIFNVTEPTFGALWLCVVLCNVAEFKTGQQQVPIARRSVSGTLTEAALLRFAVTVYAGIHLVQQQHYKLAELPFNKKTNFQVSVHELADEQAYFMLQMLGSPEQVVECCSSIMIYGETVSLSSDWREQFEQACQVLASMGERILAFADLMLPKAQYPKSYKFSTQPVNFPLSGLRFLGLISMADPPRTTVEAAIRKCRAAGVRVMMFTGDHPTTAKTIAQRVGIITKPIVEHISADESGASAQEATECSSGAIVMHGDKLAQLSFCELAEIIKCHDEIIFARSKPQQKLSIVLACQLLGEIVAITGRGISDVAALRRAHIGVTMESASSYVAKHSADIILLDDEVASLQLGIEEGRLVFDNLKKSIAYTLTSNMPQLMPFILCLMCSMPLALGLLAVLCIDIVIDILPAISLGYERAESDLMLRKSRAEYENQLVSTNLILKAYLQIGVIQAAACFVTFFAIMAEYGFLPERLYEARHEWDCAHINDLLDSYGQEWTYYERKVLQTTAMTGFFVSIVVTQWCNLIICKTRHNSILKQGMRNTVLNIALIIETTIALLICHMPTISDWLRFHPLKLIWWTYAIPFGLLIIVYDETRRFIIRRRPGGWLQRETYY